MSISSYIAKSQVHISAYVHTHIHKSIMHTREKTFTFKTVSKSHAYMQVEGFTHNAVRHCALPYIYVHTLIIVPVRVRSYLPRYIYAYIYVYYICMYIYISEIRAAGCRGSFITDGIRSSSIVSYIPLAIK